MSSTASAPAAAASKIWCASTMKSLRSAGQSTRRANRAQIGERAGKINRLGEHGNGGCAVRRVERCDLHRIGVRANGSGAGRTALDLGDDVDTAGPGKRFAEDVARAGRLVWRRPPRAQQCVRRRSPAPFPRASLAVMEARKLVIALTPSLPERPPSRLAERLRVCSDAAPESMAAAARSAHSLRLSAAPPR